jgi:serine/threonine-protein kinase RsbW
MTSQQQERGIGAVRLEFPASLQFLSMVGVCLNDLLVKAQSQKDIEFVSYDIQLAVQELCTNIVHHAYEDRPNAYEDRPNAYEDRPNNERICATITFYNHPRRVVIELEDTGKFFDEMQVEEPNLEEGQIHGYGLFLIKSLMDEVIYTRNANSNSWYLVKNLEEVVSSLS